SPWCRRREQPSLSEARSMRAPPAVQSASSPWCEQITFNAVAFAAGASAFAEASADRRGPQRGSRVGVACRSLGGGWSASLAEARKPRRAEAGDRTFPNAAGNLRQGIRPAERRGVAVEN